MRWMRELRVGLLFAVLIGPLSGTLPRLDLPASVQTDRCFSPLSFSDQPGLVQRLRGGAFGRNPGRGNQRGGRPTGRGRSGGWGSQGGEIDPVEQEEARAEGIRRARNKKRRGGGWDSDSENDAAVEALHVPGLGLGNGLPASKRRDKGEEKREEVGDLKIGGGWAGMAAAGTDVSGNLNLEDVIPAAADPSPKRSSRQCRGVKKKEDAGDANPPRQKGEEGAKGGGEEHIMQEGGSEARESGVKEGGGAKGERGGKGEKGAAADPEGDEDEEGLDLGGKEPVHAGKVSDLISHNVTIEWF